MSTPADMARLLDVLRDHLAFRPVPAGIASAEVVTDLLREPRAAVQLSGFDLPAVSAGLLAWADTLTEVTATAWRPSGGTTVHLVVTGRLGGGLAVKVYGCVPHTTDVFGSDLQPDGRQSVALGVLRAWATAGEVAA